MATAFTVHRFSFPLYLKDPDTVKNKDFRNNFSDLQYSKSIGKLLIEIPQYQILNFGLGHLMNDNAGTKRLLIKFFLKFFNNNDMVSEILTTEYLY